MIEVFTSNGIKRSENADFLEQVAQISTQTLPPFHGIAKDVLSILSKQLLKRRDAPQLTALGYWLRPAAIQQQESNFRTSVPENEVVVPRGLAVHFPPTNVDTLFVYSWVLSLLAGNSNVVRLPSERAPSLQWLIAQLIAALQEAGDPSRHVFCSYSHTSDLNKDLSAMADLRMIWGGDAKVLSVSKNPVRPDGLSLGFPDRKSLCTINAAAYSTQDSAQRDALAQQFYNDVYWFDQMGCGSPRILIWIGTEDKFLSNDFYARVAKVATRKDYGIETGAVISKFSYMNDMVAEQRCLSGQHVDNRLDVLELAPGTHTVDRVVGGGMLMNTWRSELPDIRKFLNKATQTITHFGFEPDALKDLAGCMSGVGGYRIVPIGQALAFAPTWDGVRLLDHASRRISIIA